MSGHEKRVLSLDGLRGLAALIVFLYHVDIMVKPFGAGGPSLFPGGASVMVFFILSGIVLSLVPFKHMGNGGYDWLGYYRLIGQNVCPRWGHRRRSMPLFQPFKFGARF